MENLMHVHKFRADMNPGQVEWLFEQAMKRGVFSTRLSSGRIKVFNSLTRDYVVSFNEDEDVAAILALAIMQECEIRRLQDIIKRHNNENGDIGRSFYTSNN